MNARVFSVLFLVAGVAEAQKQPAIRPLGTVGAVSTEPLLNVQAVRHLSDGRLLVNDIAARRVLLMDSDLKVLSVVADSTSATQNAYSGRIGGLIPYRADSTLFIDPQSLSMLMIDPKGKVARVLSVPRAEDAMALTGMQGAPGLDSEGRLVYRGALNFARVRSSPDGPMLPVPLESLPIVRIDLATRKLDTLAFTKIPKIKMNVTRDDNGRVTMTSEVNPLPLVDDWAVTSSGAVAIVRGQDYHVDWINPDGTKWSSAKIPFEWQRLSDEDKVAFIDSVKAMRERMAQHGQPAGGMGMGGAMITMSGGPPPAGAAPGAARGEGERRTVVMGGGGPPAGGAGGANRMMPNLTFIPASDLPDYKPPFFVGAVRADGDGNLWIRTIPTRAVPGGPVYDVINGKGELVERVQVPEGRTIVGFGPGGVVYLAARDAQNQTTVERASAK